MTTRHPSYRYHKARHCAVVTLDGKDHYLGAYNSPDSWETYHRLVAEWLVRRRSLAGFQRGYRRAPGTGLLQR